MHTSRSWTYRIRGQRTKADRAETNLLRLRVEREMHGGYGGGSSALRRSCRLTDWEVIHSSRWCRAPCVSHLPSTFGHSSIDDPWVREFVILGVKLSTPPHQRMNWRKTSEHGLWLEHVMLFVVVLSRALSRLGRFTVDSIACSTRLDAFPRRSIPATCRGGSVYRRFAGLRLHEPALLPRSIGVCMDGAIGGFGQSSTRGG